jgi:hypothetical protein
MAQLTSTGVTGKPTLLESDEHGPLLRRTNELQGVRVINGHFEKLGELREIIIDLRTGRVMYGVLAVGGVLGVKEKLHPIPWQALKLDCGWQCFVLDVAKERLRAAPEFEQDQWPALADAEWAAQVSGHCAIRCHSD